MEAVGIFICFFAKETYYKSRLLKTLSSASLAVYLIHMHPVFKVHYVEWGIFRWINIANRLSRTDGWCSCCGVYGGNCGKYSDDNAIHKSYKYYSK